MGKVQRTKDGLLICRRCGKIFSATDTPRRVFCSAECARPVLEKPEVKTCEYCGEEYKPNLITASYQRFCSEGCQRAWHKENRDWSKTKGYLYICQNCGREYETKYRDRDTCCSRECGWEWLGRLETERALIEKQCLSCGQTYQGVRSHLDYCSDECKERGMEHACKVCGNKFYSRNSNASICSDKCQNKINLQRFRAYKASIGRNSGRVEITTCKHCGREFKQIVHNQVKSFCSKKCSRSNYRNSDVGRANRSKQRYQRRANKYGNGPVENIDPLKVFGRDGWHCGICGKRVDPHLKFPHPKSVSLDHIVALANGGTHTWNNVQCAHLGCNVIKSNIGGGQLRLDMENHAD